MEISCESDAHVTCPNLFCIHEYIKYNFRANSYLVLDHSYGIICQPRKVSCHNFDKTFQPRKKGRKEEIDNYNYTITLCNNAVYSSHASILHNISQSQSNWTMPLCARISLEFLWKVLSFTWKACIYFLWKASSFVWKA